MRYIKKPLPVEAVQIPETNSSREVDKWLRDVAPDWVIEALDNHDAQIDFDEGIYIHTLEGKMLCPWGSYLIRGEPFHEIYPCRADVFKETYEAVGDECLLT